MIIQNGKKFTISNIDSTSEKLQSGNYILKYDDRSGYYLYKTEDFILPNKIYGDIKIVDKICNTYLTRPNKNLGVLFEGTKGCSKTLLCKIICQKLNLPVILIQDTFIDSSEAISFLSNKELGDCIIFIDEFEKIFNKDDQISILTLLDGGIQSHYLYLLTANKGTVRSEFINRPSRIYYHKFFDRLDEATVVEVIDDLLLNKSNKKDLINILNEFIYLTFDILISIIEEMNRYNQTASEIIEDFGFQTDEILVKVACKLKDGQIFDATYAESFNPSRSLEIKVPDLKSNDPYAWTFGILDPEDIEKKFGYWTADKFGFHFEIKQQIFRNLLF